ncbi:alpha/beta hydrolase [Sphingomonas spermidinifaciens]|uniref:Alpha/beta hydrolase n=1 Tax=Sphingomonas spermidinifaciens TaxID=1141889 RepID=A0A2A4B161_9SPHN|nr:alpha/beta hydrolase [Sphingomonas spermidinifaciens]PCD01800.1 alpha/beta hydrolase [Sphingomonas spermidinifaciens]
MTDDDRQARDRRDGASPPGNGYGIAAATALGALAATSVFNHLAARRAERRHPPIGRLIDIDGVRVHALDGGTGPPVVLLHGSGSLVQDFITSGLVDALKRTNRVIVFDRPGYGYSDRPRGQLWTPERQARLLVRALAALGIERPVVFGHSWGTLVALAWALDHPDAVSRLVLASGYYYPTPRADMIPTGLTGMPIVGDMIASSWAPIQARLFGPLGNKAIFSPAKVPQAFRDNMPFGLMMRPSQLRATGADSGQMPIAAARLAKRYAELALPIAVLWGEGDKLVDQHGQSRRFHASLPAAAGGELAGAGHMLHHVHTQAVARCIAEGSV